MNKTGILQQVQSMKETGVERMSAGEKWGWMNIFGQKPELDTWLSATSLSRGATSRSRKAESGRRGYWAAAFEQIKLSSRRVETDHQAC
jgi:hypothetical protein